ncbi:MAG: holin [Clostridiales bacterium]|jgi:hypothetical protein|nr:holin [Clostridiales bacterium]
MNFSEIIIAFVTVLASFALTILSRYVRSKVSAADWSNAIFWVKAAVAAAEQLYGAGKGEKKREYVRNAIDFLELGEEEKEILIESAVRGIKE